MPVAARRPRDTGPSGLDKFLQTINIAAGIGGRVADFIQNKRQLGIQEQYLENQEETQAMDRYSRALAMGLNAAEAGRNANLATLASQGQAIDPNVALAATILGDIADPTLRESTREAVAGLLGKDPTEIGDRFILSPDTLASESERDITEALERIRNYRRITGQATLGPGAEAAARVGETGQLSLVPGSQIGSFERREALQNQINEMLRVELDPDTGEYTLSGAALNNAGNTLDIMLQMVGEQGLPKEFDPSQFGLSGPNRVVSGPVWDELTRNALTALWQDDNDARSTMRDSAQLLTQEFGIPFEQSLALVEGRIEDVNVGNAQFYDAFRKYHRGVIEFVGQMSPVNRQLITLGNIIHEEMGIPSDQVVEALSAFSKMIFENNPSAPVVRNIGVLEGMKNFLFGGPTGFEIGNNSVFTPSTEPVTAPSDATGTGASGMLSGVPLPPAPDPQQVIRDEAMGRAMSAFANALRAMTPEQRSQAAQGAVGLQTFQDPETGELLFLNVTQEMMDQILSQIQ